MVESRTARNAPRILYVENVGWGFLTHRVAFAVAAQAAGYDVHVATDLEHDDERTAIERCGFTFHRLSLARGLAGFGRDFRSLCALGALYRRLRPDIVHHVTIKPVIYGTLAARWMPSVGVVNTVSGLGHLYVVHDRRTRFLRSLASLGYRAAFARKKSRTIFQNDDDLRRFPSVVQAVIVEGAGVDLAAFTPSDEPFGDPWVVLPARMLREKGVVEFAEAARMLRTAGVRARFLLAGTPDSANPGSLTEHELDALEKECGVEWLGYQKDMPAILRKSSIVCLPSYYGEGMPKALLEAAACGRAIVTTDIPGCRHVVTHEHNGLLVAPRDARALAAALRRLIEDRELRVRLGRHGRAIAESRFDVKRLIAQTLAIYETLLDDRYFSATTAAM